MNEFDETSGFQRIFAFLLSLAMLSIYVKDTDVFNAIESLFAEFAAGGAGGRFGTGGLVEAVATVVPPITNPPQRNPIEQLPTAHVLGAKGGLARVLDVRHLHIPNCRFLRQKLRVFVFAG